MGQNVTVRAKPSSNPEILRFEANRSLTGMGHEHFASIDDVVLDRPVDVLARRFFDAGGIEGIHVNSSMITVHLAGGTTGEHLTPIVADLFRFYDDEGNVIGAEAETVEAEEAAPADAEPAAVSADT